jgi:hypothetical protein
MQTFFFHLVYDSGTIKDPEGSSLSDLETASVEACTIIRELAAAHLMSGKPFLLQCVHICTRDDRILANVSVSEAIRDVMSPNLLTRKE